MKIMRVSAAICAAVFVFTAAPGQAARAQEAVAQTLIEQRILAQQGLAIGLANIILKSQFAAFGVVQLPVGFCLSLAGGGSAKALSNANTSTMLSGRVQVYFDSACTKVYLDETLTENRTTGKISATAQVFSKAAKKVGTLAINNGTKISNPTPDTVKLVGTMSFQPVQAGAKKITLGLSCELPNGAQDEPVSVVCSAGIAQDFPLIGKAVGSVTKVSLDITDDNSVTFSQAAPAKLMTGAIGALSVKVTAAGAVSVAGTQKPFGTTTLSGKASQLVLFPPKPVTWTVTDQAHKAKFTLQLLNDTTRSLSGGIKSLTNQSIAPIALDQSGTGTIKYSNGVVAPISSWVLTK